MYRLLALILAIACGFGAQMFTQTSPSNDDKQRPLQEVLAKAADSLGGADKLRSVQSLLITGRFRRSFPDQERSGDYQLFFMSPDRFKKIETGDVARGTQIVLTQALNQNEQWSTTGVKTSGLEINVDKPSAQTQTGSPNARKQLRADLSRHLLALFLASPASMSMEFREVEPADPSKIAFDMKGADGFSARIVLDPKTYLPLSMTYQGRPPLISVDPSNPANSPEVHDTEIVVRFADYRSETGIRLPHRLTVESDGKFLEEFEMKICRVNPAELTASDFRKN